MKRDEPVADADETTATAAVVDAENESSSRGSAPAVASGEEAEAGNARRRLVCCCTSTTNPAEPKNHNNDDDNDDEKAVMTTIAAAAIVRASSSSSSSSLSPTPPVNVNLNDNGGHGSSIEKTHFSIDNRDSRGFLTSRSREGSLKMPAPTSTVSAGRGGRTDVASREAEQPPAVTSEGAQQTVAGEPQGGGGRGKTPGEQGPSTTNGGESSSRTLNRTGGKKASPSSCKPVRKKKEGAGIAELFEGAASHTVDCLLYIRWYAFLGCGISEKPHAH